MKSGFKLVFPTLEYKDRVIDYINEFTAIAKKDMKGTDKWLA